MSITSIIVTKAMFRQMINDGEGFGQMVCLNERSVPLWNSYQSSGPPTDQFSVCITTMKQDRGFHGKHKDFQNYRTQSVEETCLQNWRKTNIIFNHQSSCGKWPAPSIILSLTLVAFSFRNSSATDWGKYLSDTPQARSIGLSHLKLGIQLVTLKCIKRNAQVSCMRN